MKISNFRNCFRQQTVKIKLNFLDSAGCGDLSHSLSNCRQFTLLRGRKFSATKNKRRHGEISNENSISAFNRLEISSGACVLALCCGVKIVNLYANSPFPHDVHFSLSLSSNDLFPSASPRRPHSPEVVTIQHKIHADNFLFLSHTHNLQLLRQPRRL